MVEKIDWHITITKAHVYPSESLPQVSKVYFFILEIFYEHMLRGTLIKCVQELKKNEKILCEINEVSYETKPTVYFYRKIQRVDYY